MPSINITLFSGISKQSLPVSVPILNQAILIQRTIEIVKRHKTDSRCAQEKCHVNCRELFQKGDIQELFFFPASHGRSCSLGSMSLGPVFFIEGRPGCGFILCFSPERQIRNFSHKEQFSCFLEENGYPAGASVAPHFFFSPSHLSILISEYGEIITNNCGELVLKGIEVAFLQKKSFGGKSIFVQKKNECVSPTRSLSVQRYNKYIKVRCICPNPDFSYSTQFPVLAPEELKKEINCDKAIRLLKYGAESHLTKSDPLIFGFFDSLLFEHVIFLPRGMGIDVPFGACQGGRLFFSYIGKDASIRLVFFPQLFEAGTNPQSTMQLAVKNRFGKTNNRSNHNCGTTKASIFTSSTVKLVQCSPSEYKLDGARVIMTSTKKNGGWAVCLYRETINLASSILPGISGTESDCAPSTSFAQAAATVYISLKQQGQQTQQEGRSSPVSGPSELENRGTTTQAAATVYISPKRQGKQTQKKRRSPVLGPSDVSSRPYSYEPPHPYGPLPFCEGLYSYRSSIIPYSQSTATVSVPPENESPQTPYTQQRDIRNPALGPYGGSSHAYPQHGPLPFSGGPYPYFYPEIGYFVEGSYPYGSPLSPFAHPAIREGQWMPVFHPFFSAVRPSVAAFDPLRYEIPVQEEGVGHSGREKEASASVPVGAVRQTPMWRPDEEFSSAEVLPQDQADNPDEYKEDTDVDVES